MDSAHDELIAIMAGRPFSLVYNDVLKLLEGDTVAAILYTHFLSMFDLFRQQGQLQQDDWFFQSIEPIEEKFGLSYQKQSSAIDRLESLKYLEHMNMKRPQRRYIRLNLKLFFDDLCMLCQSNDVRTEAFGKEMFYNKLNHAWTLQEFGEAIDKIPHDKAEFIFAWSHAHFNTTGKKWQWTPRDYGMIKRHWDNTITGKQRFDYNRLIKFFKKERRLDDPITLGSFIHFDSNLGDNMYKLPLSKALEQDNSIFS